MPRVAVTVVLLLFLVTDHTFGQITGTVTDNQGNTLPYVNIYLKDSSMGTTTNDNGYYMLNVTEKQTYTVIFQFLGFETEMRSVSPDEFPYLLNITLTEASVDLDEVVISSNEDPAYRIIHKTIAQRKENLERIDAFTADFYSRGLWRVDSIPEKILGQEIGDFDGQLDSTRTGIIYLSETISKIAYRKPDDFKEMILASKVSGNDNGFSFNSAQDANFSFYENAIDLNASIVSPIAANAFGYYRYELDGVFYEGNKLVNKVRVIPKRPKDRVWEGYIYIVEDDWQLYGVELSTTGAAIQVPFIRELLFKQNFKFDPETGFWVKRSQTIDFSFGFFGVNGDGRFIAVYSNYDFNPEFQKKSFTNEVLSFEESANKKDSLFWRSNRPIPLTAEERTDYIKKDSIQVLRSSKTYMDSLDRVQNRFGVLDPVAGYTYRNSFKDWRLTYRGPFPGIQFNTVQGWHGGTGLTFLKNYNEYGSNWFSAGIQSTYSIAEDRVRFEGDLTRYFNRRNRLYLGLKVGTTVRQYNASPPISPLINTISSLFFERNYMKVYELRYASVEYGQELFNGMRIAARTAYEQRVPLFNNTDYVTIPDDDSAYTSNNPLDPDAYGISPFERHKLLKTVIVARITFAQKYMSYPDGKFNLGNEKYPALTLTLENATAASDKHYEFSEVKAELYQSVNTGNTGQFIYRIKGGAFIAGEGISFMDYQHFNGNQTRIGTAFNYSNEFHLLPYYDFSTNKHFAETHLEHDFRGWILGKIPGINRLNFNLVAGAHVLGTANRKPYSELSLGIDNLGIGKYRLLRLDYVRSFYDGNSEGAFIFGLKFLGILE